MNSIDPAEVLEVSLTAKQWNIVLAMANDGLLGAAAILADIQRQCLRPKIQPWEAPARTNGEAREGDTP